MEAFKDLGFTPLDQPLTENPKITAHLQRYQGMGWYDLLIENPALTIPARYMIISFGGSNGYDYEDNVKNLQSLDDQSEYQTLEELVQNISDTWCQIVQKQDLGDITVQTVQEISRE